MHSHNYTQSHNESTTGTHHRTKSLIIAVKIGAKIMSHLNGGVGADAGVVKKLPHWQPAPSPPNLASAHQTGAQIPLAFLWFQNLSVFLNKIPTIITRRNFKSPVCEFVLLVWFIPVTPLLWDIRFLQYRERVPVLKLLRSHRSCAQLAPVSISTANAGTLLFAMTGLRC